jgi:putative aminopeptidase FrvX
MLNALELLREFLAVYAPSAQENNLSRRIADLTRPYGDVSADSMHNVRVRMPGELKLLLCAAMDTPGLAITHHAGGGFFRFACMSPDVTGALCRPGHAVVVGDTLGILVADSGFNQASPNPDLMYIDFGPDSGVAVGDIAAPAPDIHIGSQGIRGAAVSRAGCVLLLQTLAAHTGGGLSCLFTARRGLTSRGARNAASSLDAALIVSVELSVSGNTPAGFAAAFGGGPVLRLIDGRFPYRAEALDALRKAAERAGVPLQTEAVALGQPGEASVLSMYGGGTPAAVLGLPARNLDTHAPLIHAADLEAAGKVLSALALEVCRV